MAAGKGLLGENGVLNSGKELQQRTQRAGLVRTGAVREWSRLAERWEGRPERGLEPVAGGSWLSSIKGRL